jgi:FkbM family methyltransferase
LPLLKALNRDIGLCHHWTGKPITLRLFEHKGYWYQGADRERAEMNAFASLLQAGDCVVEMGGHIGYTSLYLAKPIGPDGKPIVFEPGSNNLKFLRSNTASKSNIHIVEAACSTQDGEGIFHLDNLTGQNNSLVAYFSGLRVTALHTPGVPLQTTPATVSTVALADWCNRHATRPTLIKIDVEGHELAVLEGALPLLTSHSTPILMVEIQADQAAINHLLRERCGYSLYSSTGIELAPSTELGGDVFALHPAYHGAALQSWVASPHR